ncbi:hypothetical conserved protein [Candidatus Nitrosoglobus terrae]|uniref:Hypothetical conserved protein n=1 Tax=Candidatus Nitrosoglobus terrae TaxID=1630141 RepID=A0A1Q2SM83_9GAMM|nr:MTH938/NDUFAF3 family protein [Candidatus Nitrosoglobus terrae]BAW80244.1 hypothetical conserved protein [Candidatus Nitrosoglobus terrae]
MKFSLDERADVYTVKSYGSGYIEFNIPIYSEEVIEPAGARIKQEFNQKKIYQSVIVTPSRLHKWPPNSLLELKEIHIKFLLKLAPEVVLIGTGNYLQFPASYLIESLWRNQIGVEFMDTAAACRTYNILVGEGRRIAAALIVTTPSDS